MNAPTLETSKTPNPQIQPSLEIPLPLIHYVTYHVLIRNFNLIHSVVSLTLKFCLMGLHANLCTLYGVINISIFFQPHQFFCGHI